MELIEYVAPLRKWWWLITIATVIAAAASFFVVTQQPNVYRARTTLMIGRAIDDPNPSGTEFWLTQQLAQTYAEIATRDPVQFGTMKALGLAKMPDYSVKVLEETQLIEFSVTDAIPERAQAVANQLAEQLILQSPTSPDQEDQSRKQFISSQLNGLEESISETEVEIANQQDELTKVSSARQISEIRTQITGLQSKLSSLQANYANLLANTAQGALNSLSIIENASMPQTPIGPNTITTVLVAATIGFALAAGVAYFLEYLDDTVSTAEEITKLTGLATLAGIAKIDVTKDKGTLITLSQPRSPISEAYRGLRTGIQYSSVDNPDKATLMVTSPNPMEGKSVTVANLSAVMAQAGFRVLIIDADLRRPTQHELFGLSANNGLTTLLLELDIQGSPVSHSASLLKLVQSTKVSGLDLLSSGPIPPNPSELLGSKKMEIALRSAAKYYNYVIIDTPPILAVTDATVLSRKIDDVLLVVQAGNTRRPQLKQAVDQLNKSNAHLIGAVLNRLTPRINGYDSYYYRSSYYEQDIGEGDPGDSNDNGAKRRWRKRSAPEVAPEST